MFLSWTRGRHLPLGHDTPLPYNHADKWIFGWRTFLESSFYWLSMSMVPNFFRVPHPSQKDNPFSHPSPLNKNKNKWIYIIINVAHSQKSLHSPPVKKHWYLYCRVEWRMNPQPGVSFSENFPQFLVFLYTLAFLLFQITYRSKQLSYTVLWG